MATHLTLLACLLFCLTVSGCGKKAPPAIPQDVIQEQRAS